MDSFDLQLERRARDVFLTALEREPGESRESYISEACGGDARLRELVEGLIRHEEKGVMPGLAGPTFACRDEESAGIGLEKAGQLIGRYKLLELIGEGGFGVVWMAEQVEPVSRKVALKVIKAGMDTRQVIARFEAERQALALMDHPNIARVLDAGATDAGRPYFVMELVRGLPLTTFCDERGLSTNERLELFRTVCDAIQHAHQKGIIHRDLKPSNVLVTLQGDQPVPKVIDFGIAKATQQKLTEKTLFTQFAQFVGTPAYMSPEQVTLSGLDIDTRSDVYSLGVLLYEVLTGGTPFDRDRLLSAGLDEMRRIIREDDPPRPSTRLSTMDGDRLTQVARCRRADPHGLGLILRGDLDWMVMKALEKDRARRYETASAFGEDIRRHLCHEAVAAVPPTAAYRVQKFVRRNRGSLAVAGIIFLLLAAGTAVSAWQAVRATRASERERAARLLADQSLTRALDAEQLARKEAGRSQASQYVAEMNLAQRELRQQNVQSAVELLRKHVPEPGELDLRGFEWRSMWFRTHRELASLRGHAQEVRDLVVSRDGRLLVSAGFDATIRLWDLKGQREIGRIEGPTTWCNSVGLSPDARLLAYSFWDWDPPHELVVLDVMTRAELKRFGDYPSGITCVRWHPSRETIVAGCADGTVRIRDLSGGGSFDLEGLHARVRALAFVSNGNQLVAAGDESHMQVWSLPDRSVIRTLKGHVGPVYALAVSPDEQWIVSGGFDGRTVVWSAEDGTEVRVITHGELTPIGGLAFSRDGGRLAMIGINGQLQISRTGDWAEEVSYHHRSNACPVTWTPEGRVISGAKDGEILIWSPEARESEARELDVRDRISVVVCSSTEPDRFAVGTIGGEVQVYRAGGSEPELKLPALPIKRGFITPFDTRFIAFSQDGESLAVVRPAGAVEIWDVATSRQVQRLEQDAAIFCLGWSPTEDLVAAGTGGRAAAVQLWRGDPLSSAGSLNGRTRDVLCLDFSPDGRILATGSLDGAVHLWDLNRQEMSKGLVTPDPRDAILGIAFSPDARLVAACSYNKQVYLWDSTTGEVLASLAGHFAPPQHVIFTPDGRRVVSSSWNGTTKFWDLSTLSEVATFDGAAADFSADGLWLATGGDSHFPVPETEKSRSVRLHFAPAVESIDREIRSSGGAP